MLRLEAIDRHNFRDIVALSVDDAQKTYIASNLYSLAQAYVQPECVPLAVYEKNEPVGFVMYAMDEDEREYSIYRVMIDKRYQSRGFGREALRLLLERLQADRERHVIFISFAPENAWAKALYESVGFVSDDRIEDGELIYRLNY